MRQAIISGGVVVNVIVGELPDGITIAEDSPVGIGWTYDGQTFAPPIPVIVVPASVTMRQARLALLSAGKIAAVEAAIDALPEPGQSAARIEWEYAATVDRASPLIATLAPALELDDAALDGLFMDAAER